MTLTALAGAAGSLTAQSIKASRTVMPPSFNDATSLFVFNLFLLTAAFFLGAMMVGKQVQRIWLYRLVDHPLKPVTIYRTILFLAALGFTLRCGAGAMELWGWNPLDLATTARVLMAKRWLDPVAIVCGLLWMSFAILAEPGIEHQLRKPPLPGVVDPLRPPVPKVDMWSRWPALIRAAAVVVLSFTAALAAVCLR